MKGSYTFLPWARGGLANQISEPDPNPGPKLRAEIDVALELGVRRVDGADETHGFTRTVQLYGPGDLIGLESRSIVRTDPRPGVTNFEPNYLAAIEFYDEDLPWRYTPSAPDAAGNRLRPWIMLAVLAEDEFKPGANVKDRPLPYITLTDTALADALPDPATLWAWAHVHVNRGLTSGEAEIVSADRDGVAARLGALVAENADLAYSRIVSPRRLAPNKRYSAFVLPVFETGRLAGLGKDPAASPSATASAWTTGGADKNDFPVYFRWTFRTGASGDFETLVRLLQARPVDARVGQRDMDVQDPGVNLPGIDGPRSNGMLRLGGALRVPRLSLSPDQHATAQVEENWSQPAPHVFQRQLAALINLSDDYSRLPSAQANAQVDVADVVRHPDPVISPPLYGRWHALTPRLLKDRNQQPLPEAHNWIHELNLDPRFRVPAGLGTRVVQNKQEDLMAAAWEQVGDVLEANRRIRRFKFAQQVSRVWYRTHLEPIADRNPGRALALTAPVHSRVMAGPVTTHTEVAASTVPRAMLAPAMRRATRPGSRMMRALSLSAGQGRAAVPLDALIERVNRGDIAPAPPKVAPSGLTTVDDVVNGALPDDRPRWLISLLGAAGWIAFVPLAMALVGGIILWQSGFGLWWLLALDVAGLVVTMDLVRTLRIVRSVDALHEENQTPASLDDLPASPGFRLTDPRAGAAGVTAVASGTDSAEATRFKEALKALNTILQASAVADTVGENGPARAPLDLHGVANRTLRAIDPRVSITRLALSQVRIPPRIQADLPEAFVEAMAHPVFDLPMYAPLRDLSAEMLIPNVNLIENNSITLLETNQKFIEAYMVGLNHEFARELLWREYPTDQRGSYFRQFWDVSSYLPVGSDTEANTETLRESLRDIPPLHRWPKASALGEHDARERPGGNKDEVVLVIRGELLKRYPNAVIYAQAADWQRLSDGSIDRQKERRLVDLSAAEEDDPPRAKLRTPLYQAKIDPDIFFFGFDLTARVARGGSGAVRSDPAGWFFVIKERPGEPRFGFDEQSASPIVVYNDLGWDRVPLDRVFIRPVGGAVPSIPAATPSNEAEKNEQRIEDAQVKWDNSVSSAELAYVMYQAPVMVAVHAAEMLPSP